MTPSKPLARFLLAALPVAILALNRSSHAYVDLAPTLASIINSAQTITIVEVASFDRDSRTVTLKVVRTLKGTPGPDTLSQTVSTTPTAAVPRPIVQWASPGARAVVFSYSNLGVKISMVCFGTGWYQIRSVGTGAAKLDTKERPDLPLAYYGTVARLSEGVEAMLAGKPAPITVVAHGAQAGSFDLALNRQSLPGIVRVQRLRASLSMPGSVMAASSNPAYFIGDGAADESDIPALLQKLKSPDAAIRAEAVEDLRSLKRTAQSASDALAGLLKDASPRVRFNAASALLVVAPRDAAKKTTALEVLNKGLASTDNTERRFAVAAAGFSGAGGAPLTDKLAALLKDSDEVVRISALQSISMLGPAAEKAVPAVIPLLDDVQMAMDAADALGRIGAAARPALKRLTAMLSAEESATRWAAVRSMSQIGGPEAHPAVDFMVKQMPTANEVEGYNMMIYLSLLGPVAADAAGAVQNFRVKNPVLPSTTLWAMNPERSFPWEAGGFGGGRGGRGGGGGGGRGGPNGGFVEGPGMGQGMNPMGPGQGMGGQGMGGGAGGMGPGQGDVFIDPNGGGFGGGPGGQGGRGGRGGGPGGGGPGGLGDAMYQAYVAELGPRLRPLAPILARRIMDGTAGEVPTWGYKILAAGPDLALEILVPQLMSPDLLVRERAAVALGYMGESAYPAREVVEAVHQRSTNPREKKLLEWCMREIE